MDNIFKNYNKTILIVTFGRTGSTLLNGILNTIPTADIKGENCNFCYGVFNLYKNYFLEWMKHTDGNIDVTHPWYGVNLVNESNFIQTIQYLILKTLYPHGSSKSTLGFKEIRYLPAEILKNNNNVEYEEMLFSYFDFLIKILKNVKIIFHTREYNNVLKSGWWKYNKNKEVVRNEFRMFDSATLKYEQKNPGSCFRTSYEQITKNMETIKDLFLFLGEKYNEAFITSALEKKYSFTTSQFEKWVIPTPK